MPSFPAGFSGPSVASKRKRADLSQILDRRLATYALTAGAAGVSIAASAQAPKENTIVYAAPYIAFAGEAREHFSIPIDLNGDGITDITINANGFGYSNSSQGVSSYSGAASWMAAGGAGGVDAALPQGREIGPARKFADGGPLLRSEHRYRHHQSQNRCRGPFQAPYRSPLTAYLGLEFQIDGETHYGWVRLSTQCGDGGFVLGAVTGYAYNTVAAMPIRTGQTSDVAGDSETTPEAETPDPATSKTNATPATLGALSLGAQGLAFWRRDSK